MLAAHECGLEGLQRSCSIRLDSACRLDRCASLVLSKRQYMRRRKCAVRTPFVQTSELSLCSSVDFSQAL